MTSSFNVLSFLKTNDLFLNKEHSSLADFPKLASSTQSCVSLANIKRTSVAGSTRLSFSSEHVCEQAS